MEMDDGWQSQQKLIIEGTGLPGWFYHQGLFRGSEPESVGGMQGLQIALYIEVQRVPIGVDAQGKGIEYGNVANRCWYRGTTDRLQGID